MAEADIAYVATAGAAGLALALSAWAARLRGRLAERAQVMETELTVARAALADRDGALAAFEDARLTLTPDGHTRRLGAPAVWTAITRDRSAATGLGCGAGAPARPPYRKMPGRARSPAQAR